MVRKKRRVTDVLQYSVPLMRPSSTPVMGTPNDVPYRGGDYIPQSAVVHNRNARLLQINSTLGAGAPEFPPHPVGFMQELPMPPSPSRAPGRNPAKKVPPLPVLRYAMGGTGRTPGPVARKPAAKKAPAKPSGGASKQVK